ncbi:uncharacterized protein A4U43_C01F29620 [Asparagus officinalis]|uniref:Uncharacterized protein n=1 Tax=Asparagus officinalis TaxID=4686 RepID=A0A5P1FU26_ASPOF|nr:uncharacterized protein A4U43_C01F29620 [Asparagus officinalis]
MTVMKTMCSLEALSKHWRYLQKEKTSGPDGNSVMYELAERALHESISIKLKDYIAQDGVVFWSSDLMLGSEDAT